MREHKWTWIFRTWLVLTLVFTYFFWQGGKVWWNDEWAGILMTRGYYRSWSMRFCDGTAYVDGKWQSVILTTNGMKAGHYVWPRFHHTAIKGDILHDYSK